MPCCWVQGVKTLPEIFWETLQILPWGLLPERLSGWDLWHRRLSQWKGPASRYLERQEGGEHCDGGNRY